MEEEIFYAIAQPINNPFKKGADTDLERMKFDLSPEELEFVKQYGDRFIYTLIDNNEGWFGVSTGYHYVNRVGYFIASVPWTEFGEYTFYDEAGVNEWFYLIGRTERALLLDTDLSDDATTYDEWYDFSLEEKEELQQKWKTENKMKYFILIKNPEFRMLLDKDGRVRFFDYKEEADKEAKNFEEALVAQIDDSLEGGC